MHIGVFLIQSTSFIHLVKDQVRNPMDHINTIDPTGNIKFTYEEEEDKQIPFLDTVLVRREDGSVKLLVYRKKSHMTNTSTLVLIIL